MQYCTIILLSLVSFSMMILLVDSTLSKADKKKKSTNSKESTVKITDRSIVDRRLVTTEVSYKDIVSEHSTYSLAHANIKNFAGHALGYVTPWNNKGYDMAQIFNAKFNTVSPVWLQVRPYSSSDTGFTITGGHDIDSKWMHTVSRNARVMPRIIFDQWNGEHFHSLLTNQYVANGCSKTMIDFLKSNKFSGAVIEIWSQFGGRRSQELIHLLNHFAKDFKSHGLVFILVIPPPVTKGNYQGLFLPEHFEALVDAVDYFSLMTYDFTNAHEPGSNAPLSWISMCVKRLAPDSKMHWRSKILTGISFYGYDFVSGHSMDPVVGHQYVQLLKKYSPDLVWNNSTFEHEVTYSSGIGRHFVSYPTLASIRARIELSQHLGTGISIWEIGQGLDYFFELL